MAYVNVAEWSPRHVAEWLRGLDDVVQPYVQFFLNNNINGCHLLTLVSDDLTHLNVIKIGHQETILEAVELLRQLHYNLTSENLQSLALKLGCKARSLCNNLKHLNSILAEKTKQELLSTETLSSVSDILGFVKILISWLDRYPFEGQDQYKAVRKSILRYSIELASTAQRDQFAEKPTEIIQNSCYNIAEQCDTIVQKFNDSLIIQPASLNVATVRKRADEDLGIHIHSSYSGIHIIGAIKFQSPAYKCGKISEGDEIIQVNYQTVVGWQLKNLVCATREHPSEIHLTVKKRPHHSSVLEEVKTIWPCRIPSKRTAFRRMNKWSKFNSTQLPISEIAPSKSSSKQIDGLQEANNDNLYPLDGISQPSAQHKTLNGTFKQRSRINRRATIDSIPFIPKHSTFNVELERLAKTKTCNFSEKHTNSNVNKTGPPNNSSCIALLQPIDYKFGSTDSDKWNIKNDKESLSNTSDKKLPITKYIETNLHQNSIGITSENGYSSDSNSSDISLKLKSRKDTKVHRFRSSKTIQNPSTSQILGQQSIHESANKDVDFKSDTLVPIIKNEGNIKNIDILFENEKEIVHHLSDKQNISNFNHAVNIQEKSPICLESDDKSNDAKFQVVSLPSPGINTRTFTRQNSSDKKLQHDSINLSPEEISNHHQSAKQIINNQQNSSTTDISGQSDSSLDEVIDHSKSVQKNTEETNEKSEMTLKYQKIKSVEHINYKRAKNIQLRTQRRFTTDQAILPKHWEKIVNSERISAFKPVSGRSLSCIDVSETTHESHNNDVNCIKPTLNADSYEIKVLKGGNYNTTNKKYIYPLSPIQSESAKDISWNKSHFQPFNCVNSLDRKISVPKYLDSSNAVKSKCDTIKEGQLNSYKDKRDSKPPGYVAKIAESFNILSRQEPSHFPSITQIYQPVSSYATITKPKPLRGDQLHQRIICENKDYNHSNSSGSYLEKNHIKSQIINDKKIVHDVKKDYIDNKQVNKFLRTATSEEIQNMYTSYGNSGRGFEAGQNLSLNSVVKEETISNPNEILSKKAHILNEQSPEYLSNKLKSIKLKEEKNIYPVIPFFTSVARSRVSAAVQTDNNDDLSLCDDELCLNTSITSQESDSKNCDVFYPKPCQNMSDESILYSSNSSLNSSSSSGSHYYYVEAQIRPELTISVPLVTQSLTEETVENSRSSHLPRMGIAAMLGKKRSISYGSSDSGSGETSTKLEQTKEYVLKHKPFLGHTSLPIDV